MQKKMNIYHPAIQRPAAADNAAVRLHKLPLPRPEKPCARPPPTLLPFPAQHPCRNKNSRSPAHGSIGVRLIATAIAKGAITRKGVGIYTIEGIAEEYNYIPLVKQFHAWAETPTEPIYARIKAMCK